MNADLHLEPIGYQWVCRHFQVNPMPYHVESYVGKTGRKSREEGGRLIEIYPQGQHRTETIFDHLEFALKREGLHLALLRAVLPRLSLDEVAAYVASKPSGIYARRIAYLFEAFSAQRLPFEDMKMGNYVDLMDRELYFTRPGTRQPRWRIVDNLLHTLDFSPLLRRTRTIQPERDQELHARCARAIQEVPPEVFHRAMRFLYAKETRTSYAIERETPTQKRAEQFMAQLERSAREDFLNEKALVALQQAIVDPRFAADGWRQTQNYVGQTLAPGMEDIHLVPPKAEDIDFLMRQWLACSAQLAETEFVPPIAAAAAVAWLFVFMHPFLDGNGRIHRFLIHHVLARRKFGPPGVLLPVSAVILNRPAQYDASLEAFSVPLKERTDYELDAQGGMKVLNETLDCFRYVDCTVMAEALYRFIEETIETELPAELRYLHRYDAARKAMRDVVDLPETTANLFIKLCLQNDGRLSKSKRKLPAFSMITSEEMDLLEEALRAAYDLKTSDE
ncbi:MAG: Fic family protein [Prosthecobacter sp.]|uniref:Fic family protein n=1 Tax=Prosthecobacter sp. TaxID=1965333 RepID=UPI0038FFF7E6